MSEASRFDTTPTSSSPIALAIVAGTGYASEVIGIAQSPRPGEVDYEITAIVGEDALLTELAARLDVANHGDVRDLAPGTALAIATGANEARQELAATAAAAGLSVATLIHADTTIGPWVTIGAGSLISPGVRITGNVSLGQHCLVHTNAVLSHDDVIGDYVTISPSATLCGGVSIGSRSTVFAGATVMPGVRIGADATIGAGALVNTDVADGTTVVGVPARPVA